jgi:hypothetical protein
LTGKKSRRGAGFEQASEDGGEAAVFQSFSAFMATRAALTKALKQKGGDTRPALENSMIQCLRFIQAMLPETPEDIQIELAKNIVLNACRAGIPKEDGRAAEDQSGVFAEIIELSDGAMRGQEESK